MPVIPIHIETRPLQERGLASCYLPYKIHQTRFAGVVRLDFLPDFYE